MNREHYLFVTGRLAEPSYAFYLGYEMAKAVTALTLGKNYRQDEALDWGMLTVRELRVDQIARFWGVPLLDRCRISLVFHAKYVVRQRSSSATRPEVAPAIVQRHFVA